MKHCRKILFEIGNMEIAGAQKMVVDLAIYYKKHGYNVLVLVLCENPKNHFSRILCENNINVIYTPSCRSWVQRIFERYKLLSKAVRKFKPDIIHGHLDYKYVWLYAFLHRKTVITTFHSQSIRLNSKMFKYLYVLLYRKRLIIPVCLTDSNRNEFSCLFDTKIQDIAVIPNPIDLALYHPQSGLDECKKIRYCYVARFHPIKNHKMLIRAFKKVQSIINNSELLLVGDGEAKKDVEELVQRIGLKEKVIFTGEVSNVPDLLQNVQIGVISSYSESFSIFLLECMAMGIPVVLTNVGGMKDLIGNNGLFVESRDVDGMARGMIELATNYDLRNEMANKGKELAKQYDISIVANKYLDLYERVIKP